MNQSLTFLVQGSADEPYEVRFEKLNSFVTASCTCPAASYGRHCKHRIWLIEGRTKGIVSENSQEVMKVANLIKGSAIERAYQDFQASEKSFDSAKKKLEKSKQNLTKAFLGTKE